MKSKYEYLPVIEALKAIAKNNGLEYSEKLEEALKEAYNEGWSRGEHYGKVCLK